MNAGNAAQYLGLPNVMCVGGTWMIEAAALNAGDWAAIRQASAQALAALA